MIRDVLQVFAHGVVGVLQRDDVNGISGEVLGDLDALLSELKVEVLDVLDRLLIQLDRAGEDVPAEALPELLAEQLEQLVGFELQQLVGLGDGLVLRRWWWCLVTSLGLDDRPRHVREGAKADATC